MLLKTDKIVLSCKTDIHGCVLMLILISL